MTREEVLNSWKTMYFKNDGERDKAYKKVKKILDEANCCDVGYKMLLRRSNDVHEQNYCDEIVSAILEEPNLVKQFDVSNPDNINSLSMFVTM